MSVDRELTLHASPKRTRAVVSEDTFADSVDSILMLEKGHLPFYYFPPDDVRLDLLDQSDRRTHCPIKGEATYWNLNAGGRKVENAVWSYERPVPRAGDRISARLLLGQGRALVRGGRGSHWVLKDTMKVAGTSLPRTADTGTGDDFAESRLLGELASGRRMSIRRHSVTKLCPAL